MTSQETCRAKIPANCRYHGLGKELPQEAYDKIMLRIDGELLNRERFFTPSANRVFDDAYQQRLCSYLWKEELKNYKIELRNTKLRNQVLPYRNNPTTVEDHLYNDAVKVFNESTHLTMYNSIYQMLPVKAVTDSRIARSKCGVVTLKILADIDPSDLGSEKPLRSIRVDALDTKKPGMYWHHVGLVVTRGGEEYIVDYTMRQFNSKAPVPYVGKKEDWLNTLNAMVGEEFSEKELVSWSFKSDTTKEEAFLMWQKSIMPIYEFDAWKKDWEKNPVIPRVRGLNG